ncbi:hypothetical protein H2201_008122 [Coniosporium apollinis]|uniref:Uncharacterized protein n=1 Tax=Coniosporium apollinis TaxID=61459 RepID=A0ABQ9NJ23_9PEZI|nr:hypothetical protein H2201_008122 [Coniosporium apollinis]
MNPYLTLALASLYYTLYYLLIWPLLQLYNGLLAILTPISNALRFLLLPLTTLAHSLIRALLYPFGLIPNFETLYIYLGIASILGLSAGLVLALSYGLFVRLFKLDVPSEEQDPRPAARTAKEYREARQRKKKELADPILAYGYGELRTGTGSELERGRQGRGGVLGEPILEVVGYEEEDDVEW